MILDVSQFQGDIDWERAHADGVVAAFCRVADGGYEDITWTAARVRAMRKAGVQVGCYFFARTGRHPEKAARRAIRLAKRKGWGKRGDLRLALDIEDGDGHSGAHIVDWCERFIAEYQSQTGHLPVLYTMPGFMGSWSREVARCPLWIAHVGDGGRPRLAQPSVPAPWDGYVLHQYSWTGRVNGIRGNVDLNRLRNGASLDDLTIGPSRRLRWLRESLKRWRKLLAKRANRLNKAKRLGWHGPARASRSRLYHKALDMVKRRKAQIRKEK